MQSSNRAADNAGDESTLRWWEPASLESVGKCPVCSSRKRSLLYGRLRDWTYYCAPGEWKLWICGDCCSGYIDERPNVQSIHLAYEAYYTHETPQQVPAAQLSPCRRLQRTLANGYRNRQYGTELQPANRAGSIAALIMPGLRARLDMEYRHLPRSLRGRVLDVGCGNGSFMERAIEAGWRAMGIDTDPVVVADCSARNLDVHLGTLETFPAAEETFDFVTLNHVIEHVHDPVGVLKTCHRLLKPGGFLWLVTPNINSIGHMLFAEHWRGLEPPRHLVLFNPVSLDLALSLAGFPKTRRLAQPSPCSAMFAMSHRIKRRLKPHSDTPIPFGVRLQSTVAYLLEALAPSRKEFLAVLAQKPVPL